MDEQILDPLESGATLDYSATPLGPVTELTQCLFLDPTQWDIILWGLDICKYITCDDPPGS
jgi:hypothetical protein